MQRLKIHTHAALAMYTLACAGLAIAQSPPALLAIVQPPSPSSVDDISIAYTVVGGSPASLRSVTVGADNQISIDTTSVCFGTTVTSNLTARIGRLPPGVYNVAFIPRFCQASPHAFQFVVSPDTPTIPTTSHLALALLAFLILVTAVSSRRLR
jgi:hypothetical protein